MSGPNLEACDTSQYAAEVTYRRPLFCGAYTPKGEVSKTTKMAICEWAIPTGMPQEKHSSLLIVPKVKASGNYSNALDYELAGIRDHGTNIACCHDSCTTVHRWEEMYPNNDGDNPGYFCYCCQ